VGLRTFAIDSQISPRIILAAHDLAKQIFEAEDIDEDIRQVLHCLINCRQNGERELMHI
jgi:hypothetical protein